MSGWIRVIPILVLTVAAAFVGWWGAEAVGWWALLATLPISLLAGIAVGRWVGERS